MFLLFATGVVYTGGKFAAGVVDTGVNNASGKFAAASIGTQPSPLLRRCNSTTAGLCYLEGIRNLLEKVLHGQ